LGSFTRDLAKLCLRGPAAEVELRPKSFEVLRYFIEHAGRRFKEEVVSAVRHRRNRLE
jgi:DNA-binding response OmpR family regulator